MIAPQTEKLSCSDSRWGCAATPEMVLQEGLAAHFGHPVHVTRVDARELSQRSTHPIERWNVTLDSGAQMRLVLKRLDYGRPESGTSPSSNEVRLYRSVLAGSRFGAPLLYASVIDELAGHYWLFLEDVGDATLRHASREAWIGASQRLGELHGAYSGRLDELRELDWLGEQGTATYAWIARTARHHLALAAAHQALARLDVVFEHLDRLIESLLGEPRTLVHGDIFSHNFAVQPGPRIRLIDWEAAGAGVSAWDLACLLDGWGSERPILIEAYLETFARYARVPLDRSTLEHSLRLCKVMVLFRHLSWSAERCRDADFVDEVVQRLERAWAALEAC